jgi:uncharacterized protein with PQ loop repeat
MSNNANLSLFTCSQDEYKQLIFNKEKALEIPQWKQDFEKYMIIFVIFSHTFLLLQIVKIYTTKDATSLSLPAFIVYIISSCIWLFYGIFIVRPRKFPIILSSIIALIFGTIVLIGIFLYG